MKRRRYPSKCFFLDMLNIVCHSILVGFRDGRSWIQRFCKIDLHFTSQTICGLCGRYHHYERCRLFHRRVGAGYADHQSWLHRTTSSSLTLASALLRPCFDLGAATDRYPQTQLQQQYGNTQSGLTSVDPNLLNHVIDVDISIAFIVAGSLLCSGWRPNRWSNTNQAQGLIYFHAYLRWCISDVVSLWAIQVHTTSA